MNNQLTQIYMYILGYAFKVSSYLQSEKICVVVLQT